jgi:hypothetical protein
MISSVSSAIDSSVIPKLTSSPASPSATPTAMKELIAFSDGREKGDRRG